MPPYMVLPLSQFSGGLNLRDGADDIQYPFALDLLNVIFLPQGAVAQRPGYQKFTAAEGTNRYDSLSGYYRSASSQQLVAGAGNRLEALDTNGSNVATSTAPTASPHFFVQYAAPGSDLLFIANGTDALRQWNGSAFSSPAFTLGTGTFKTGTYLATQTGPTDNRLINAHSASQPSRLCFSNNGDPFTFANNAYVDITPGDGEPIQAVCSWGNLVFAFKQTKFAVFYGNSVDSSGNAVFNYRLFNNDIGLVSPRAWAIGRDGVYFLDRKGVYKTTGGEPTLVSDAITPIFAGNPAIYFKSLPLNQSSPTSAAMAWVNERLYCAIPTGTAANDRILVFDPRYNWWTVWDIPAAAMTAFRITGQDELTFAYSSGLKHIGRYRDASTQIADNLEHDGTGGTAITSRWRSGWLDYGFITRRGRIYSSPEVKTFRQVELWGEGQVTYNWTRDFRDVSLASDTVSFGVSKNSLWGDGTDATNLWGDGTDSTNLWGPAGTTRPRLVRRAIRGTVISFAFSNSTLNKTWTIHRMALSLRGQKLPGEIETDTANP